MDQLFRDMDEPISDVINNVVIHQKNILRIRHRRIIFRYGGHCLSRETENWETRYHFATKSPNYRSDLGFTTENDWKKHSTQP